MRYWVYQDSQILGPLAKEDFGLAGGVRPETLVCAEDSAGRMDADWLCAEDVGELSGICAAAPAPAGEDSLLEPGFGLLERLQFETLALPGEGDGEGWLTDLFAPASRIPAADLPKPDEAAREELKSSQNRVQELAAQIEQLSRRLEQLEAAPPQAPAPAPPIPTPAPKAAAAPPAPPIPAPPPPVLAPLPEVEVPAPEAIKPPVQDGPALAQDESPYRWDAQPQVGGGLPQAGSAPPPAQEPLAPAAEPEIPPALKGRPRRVVKVSAPQSLRKVEKGSPPSLPAAGKAPAALPPPPATAPGPKPEDSPYQWGPQAVPGGSLPQAGSAPLPALGAAGPAPLELNAPPATIVPGSFMPPLTSPPRPVLSPPPMFAPPVQGLEAPPVPTLAPSSPPQSGPPPMTMAFSAGVGPSAMPSALPAAGPALMPSPAAGPSTQQVLAKLAKPAPAKTEPPKAPSKGRAKTFLIIIGAASVVVVGAAWFFLFRDSKGLNTALRMDSGRPPVGAEVPEESARTAKPPLAAPPPAAQPAPQPAAPEPAPQAEAIRDERPAAIELVKEFPLDGDRSTIGQWLQYSFAATPGAQNEEKWDAGAYEESTYAVKYTVQPAGKDAITYLFEADVARKTVKGMNEASRKLLAGGTPVRGKPAAKARPVQPKKRTPPRRAAPAPPPKEVPLLPLPSDAELAPPAEDESAFRSDTVHSNL
jgi:hypothetical protein